MPRNEQKKARIYWRNQGGEERAYGDFRDFEDVGGSREALVPPGAKVATTDPDIALELAGRRVKQLEQRLRSRVLLGQEVSAGLKDYVAHHLFQKSKSGKVTDSWLKVMELHLERAVKFFGPETNLEAIGPREVERFVQWLAEKPNGRGQKCPECGAKGVSAGDPKDPLRWTCEACQEERDQHVSWQVPGLSSSTQRKNLNSLSNMYRRAASEGYVRPGYNPVAAMFEKPTDERREAQWLEVHEAALLLEAARPRERPGPTPDFSAVTHPKRRAFLEALAETGIRAEAAEAAGVDPTVIYTAPWQEDEAFRAALERYPADSRDDVAIPPARFHAILATFLLTGGRKSEVLGLAVDDISFERRTVTFRPHEWRRLKTRNAHRTVPLWPQLEEILRAYLDGDEEPTGELLFPSSRTEQEKPVRELRKPLDAASERAGWPEGEIRTKMFRHTYCAARLQTLDQGAPVSPFTVAREMGHGGQSLVDRVYGHLGEVRHRSEVVEYRIEDHAERVADRLELIA